MINASRTQFHIYLPWGQHPFSSVLNVKALVGAFNQEKALGAFSVVVKTGCGTDGSICGTSQLSGPVQSLVLTLSSPSLPQPVGPVPASEDAYFRLWNKTKIKDNITACHQLLRIVAMKVICRRIINVFDYTFLWLRLKLLENDL